MFARTHTKDSVGAKRPKTGLEEGRVAAVDQVSGMKSARPERSPTGGRMLRNRRLSVCTSRLEMLKGTNLN